MHDDVDASVSALAPSPRATAAGRARAVPARSRFFPAMAVLAVAVVLVGFSTTYFVPLLRGRFVALPWVHLHAAAFMGWIALFGAQVALVRTRRVAVHRRLGWLGAALAAAMVPSAVQIGYAATLRDRASGGDFALGQFVNVLIEMVVFCSLVGVAIVWRRDRERHKRLLLLATISLLGPAWLRFRHLLPMVENPFVVFSLIADSLLLVAIGYDWRTRGRVHPIYLTAGAAMVGVHLAELVLSTSAPWLAVARWLLPPPG